MRKIDVKNILCKQVSMSFFDRLYCKGVVRESGSIVKCFDEYHDDILIADELRKVSASVVNICLLSIIIL